MIVETIPRHLINQLFHEAMCEQQYEVCGFISALDGVPVRVLPVANRATTRTHRFVMDPVQQIDAMRTMRELGEEPYAIYHSHPQGGTTPSERDINEMAYADLLYLIISLGIDGVVELGGYRFVGRETQSVDIEVV